MSIQKRWALLKSADSLAEAECLKCCWDGSYHISALRKPHFTLCHTVTLPSLSSLSTAAGTRCHNMAEWWALCACSQFTHWSGRLLISENPDYTPHWCKGHTFSGVVSFKRISKCSANDDENIQESRNRESCLLNIFAVRVWEHFRPWRTYACTCKNK